MISRRDVGGDQHHPRSTCAATTRRRGCAGRAATSVYRYVKERSALFWGLTDRTMLRDEAQAFLAAGGRIESADMVLRMLRVALPRRGEPTTPTRATARRSRCCRRSAASRPSAARCPRRPTRSRSRASCSSSAPTPTASRRRSTRCTTRCSAADASPRNSEPVLRLSRLAADLEFQRRALRPRTPSSARPARRSQAELARVDRDVAERYFAGAAARGTARVDRVASDAT